MPENDPNLAGNLDSLDLSSISLDDESMVDVNMDINNSGEIANESNTMNNDIDDVNMIDNTEQIEQQKNSIDESLFLDSGENVNLKTDLYNKDDNLGSYLRWFLVSGIVILLSVITLLLLYSFSNYINWSTQEDVDTDKTNYINTYKDKLDEIKKLLNMYHKDEYKAPELTDEVVNKKINDIVNAINIDYIDKRDLLSPYVSQLIQESKAGVESIENLKQEIAKQGFLPKEIEGIISDTEAIDTIQRSLNALEIIRFSTATKVFGYMKTALITIAEMVKMSGISGNDVQNLFSIINSRGEQDISSYVYMCYLNPFETNADCNIIGDLDLYYANTKDESINVKLLKNTMNAINQILENENTSLFSITFNGLNAKQESIDFSIEVYTNQEDERALMAQGVRNPNIFVLTNIINGLKQSSFVVGEELNTKEVTVVKKTINVGPYSRTVNYSTMDFDLPIQKNTTREIFDYIDLNKMEDLVSNRGLNSDKNIDKENIETEESDKMDDDNTVLSDESLDEEDNQEKDK